ncbi:hypothetical protein [Kutzneria sp. CA-103260]|uniref:hypothetical protein n=1 Tax=Kutzneria sp. CA-103260 TaxID=2802641 RepID=UPI001BA82F95|nr:hypothetical protein [Kutzneria sp. CA-103260]QUQ68721.1 hypothetical protein JJ691_64680 [Kutzneria sp. CA-103260]
MFCRPLRGLLGSLALSACGAPLIVRVGDALPAIAAAVSPAMLVGGLDAALVGRGAAFAIVSMLAAAVVSLAADAVRDFTRPHRDGGGLPGRGGRPFREMLELGVAEQRRLMPPDPGTSATMGQTGTALLLIELLLAVAASMGAMVRLASRGWHLALILTVSAPLSALTATTCVSSLSDHGNSVVVAGELASWLLDGLRELRVRRSVEPGVAPVALTHNARPSSCGFGRARSACPAA